LVGRRTCIYGAHAYRVRYDGDVPCTLPGTIPNSINASKFWDEGAP